MDALSRGGWLDAFSKGECMDALGIGGWTDALSRVVGCMR